MTWIHSEPVRTRVYPLVILVTAFLVTRGVIDDGWGNFLLAGIALVLGMIGVESTRATVAPVIKVGPDYVVASATPISGNTPADVMPEMVPGVPYIEPAPVDEDGNPLTEDQVIERRKLTGDDL